MLNLLWCLLWAARSLLVTQRELALENLALRHQVAVLKRTVGTRRPQLNRWDRGLWVVLSRWWTGWQQALAIVQPSTLVRWHRDAFRRFWSKKSRDGRSGRPALDRELRQLIRRMSKANPTWGAPRIRNELAKIGIEVSRSTVAKYMLRSRKAPSPTWRSFLDNHIKTLVSLGQSPYVERLVGSVRRDCLDHVIVLNEQHLRRILPRHFDYYGRWRCHLSLQGDAPEPRAVHGPELGRVIELPEVGELHHRYVREAA